jgi:hypothetical protein
MPELGQSGSVRGARGNSRLYRDHSAQKKLRRSAVAEIPSIRRVRHRESDRGRG